MTQTPKQCKSGKPCAPQTLKEAVDCLAHHSVHTLREMCERTGLDYGRLAKKCSLYEARVPRVDEIIALTLASADEPHDRNLVAARFICRQLGGAFVALPPATLDSREFFGAMTNATERLSAMGREIHEALRNDNVIDEAEEPLILARTSAMHEQIAAVEALVQAHASASRARRVAPPKPVPAKGGRG